MISLLVIGFGMMIIGMRLIILRNNLRRAGSTQTELTNQVRREGLITCFVGLIVLLVGIFSPLLNTEATVVIATGASMMYIGLLSLIQWVVQSGRGTEHQVLIGARVTTWLGAALIVAYAVLRFVGVQF